MEDLRSLVRELLSEELNKVNKKNSDSINDLREEKVVIDNSKHLNSFVRRILDLSKDRKILTEIMEGKYIFKLSSDHQKFTNTSDIGNTINNSAGSINFLKGLITERDIMSVGENVSTITIGKFVRITPLAMDEIKKRSIKIEGITGRQVVLLIEKRFTRFERLLARILKAPKVVRRTMHSTQSMLWELMDGKRNFSEICTIMDSLYHEQIAPVDDRMKAYLEVFVRLNVATVLKPREEE